KLESVRAASDPLVYEWAPPVLGERRPARLVSNRPTLAAPDTCALCVGPFRIEVNGVAIVKATEYELAVKARHETGTVTIVNESSAARALRVVTLGRGKRSVKKRTLAAGERWAVRNDE